MTPHQSLVRFVRHYRNQFRPSRLRERDRYRRMPDLKQAIHHAALARQANGKCHPHQRRVGYARLQVFERSLQRIKRAIEACGDFDELHRTIARRRTDGIGDLTVYDTAVRLGAYLGLEPEHVYLHAGTLAGARTLELPTATKRLDPSLLPRALTEVSPDEAEDFLCIYKSAIAGIENSVSRGCDGGRRATNTRAGRGRPGTRCA